VIYQESLLRSQFHNREEYIKAARKPSFEGGRKTPSNTYHSIQNIEEEAAELEALQGLDEDLPFAWSPSEGIIESRGASFDSMSAKIVAGRMNNNFNHINLKLNMFLEGVPSSFPVSVNYLIFYNSTQLINCTITDSCCRADEYYQRI
jgi:hypothetical protein